ncbi:MAG TPA: hypothetical protein VK615_06090 [Candidatus Binatia bacterium]|nr:hypothetical protein [Candidatus Binatia bacterium]
MHSQTTFPVPIVARSMDNGKDNDRVRSSDVEDAIREATRQDASHFGAFSQP